MKVGRTLYTSTVRQTVAFDATICDSRWRKLVDFEKSPAASNHHGLGYLDGKIFRGTTDGQLIALDANTGVVLWHVDAADPDKRESFTSAPIGWQGKVFIGIATSDLKIAGRLMAFDATTGAMLWSFQTTVGEPNQEPPQAGGGLWSTYSLDPNIPARCLPVSPTPSRISPELQTRRAASFLPIRSFPQMRQRVG